VTELFSLAAAHDRVAAHLVGRLRRIGSYTDVAPALGAIFAD